MRDANAVLNSNNNNIRQYFASQMYILNWIGWHRNAMAIVPLFAYGYWRDQVKTKHDDDFIHSFNELKFI